MRMREETNFIIHRYLAVSSQKPFFLRTETTLTVSRSPVLEASSSCRSTSEFPTRTPSAERHKHSRSIDEPKLFVFPSEDEKGENFISSLLLLEIIFFLFYSKPKSVVPGQKYVDSCAALTASTPPLSLYTRC